VPYKDPEKRRANRRAYYKKNTDKVTSLNLKSRMKNIDKVRAHDAVRDKTPQRLGMHRKLNRIRWVEMPKGERQRLQAISLNRRIRRLEAEAGRQRPDICELCGEPGPDGGAMYFDHCHVTGLFRGWICWRCNIVLGHVDDSPDLLRKMVAYLERNKGRASPQLGLPGL
jgi:hypothetical protein